MMNDLSEKKQDEETKFARRKTKYNIQNGTNDNRSNNKSIFLHVQHGCLMLFLSSSR